MGEDDQANGGVRGGAQGGVQSLERAFTLLELMAEAGGEVALSRLAAASELPLPTIHRIVRTLVAGGYVRQLPSRRYALGPRLIGLGESSARMLGTWARPHLADLVDTVGETANMAMLDGDAVVYVAQVPSRHSMRMFTEVGRRVAVHSTGVGKALLSQLPSEAVHELLTRVGMPVRTERTLTDPHRLAVELEQIRAQGFAVDDGEQEIGVRCIAVPVVGAPTRTAISISGPEGRVTREAIPRIAPLVQRAARALGSELGAG
jgi:IclR family acetate operon transcriptional repressor